MSVKNIIKTAFPQLFSDYLRLSQGKTLKKSEIFWPAASCRFPTSAGKYSVGYEPTIRCNLKCKMCYQGQTRSQG